MIIAQQADRGGGSAGVVRGLLKCGEWQEGEPVPGRVLGKSLPIPEFRQGDAGKKDREDQIDRKPIHRDERSSTGDELGPALLAELGVLGVEFSALLAAHLDDRSIHSRFLQGILEHPARHPAVWFQILS